MLVFPAWKPEPAEQKYYDTFLRMVNSGGSAEVPGNAIAALLGKSMLPQPQLREVG